MLEDSASASAASFPGKWDPFASHVTQPIVFPTLEGQASELRESTGKPSSWTWAWAYHSRTGANISRVIFVIAIVAIPALFFGSQYSAI